MLARTYVRPGLAVFCGLAAILFGFFLLPGSDLDALYERWAFWGIALCTLLWGVALAAYVCSARERLKEWGRSALWPGLLALVLVSVMFSTTPPNFRVEYDESNLAGLAFAMYQKHEVWVPQNGYYGAGIYIDLHHVYDKRTLAYPFLVYLTHTLTGYRVENSFVVNFAAGVAALFLFFLLLRRLMPPPYAYAGMVLLGAYPVFVLSATSGGFEVLNLAFILLALLLLDSFARRRDAVTAGAFLATLVMLAQCRYESALFFPAGLALVLLLLSRAQWRALPYWLGLLSLAMIPLAWQQLLFLDPKHHQLDHGGPMFGLHYLQYHLGRAWTALSGLDGQEMFLPGVLYVALLGLGVLLWSAWRDTAGAPEARRRAWSAALFLGLGLALVSAVQFAYHHGDLAGTITARLGVIYLPLLAGCAVYSVYFVGRWWRNAPAVAVGAAICMLLLFWPWAAQNRPMKALSATRYYHILYEFLERSGLGNNVLVIAERGHPPILRGISSLTFIFANNNNHHAIMMHMQRRLFQAVLVLQEISLATGQPRAEQELGPEFRLETIYEEQLNLGNIVRISRVLGP